MYFSVCFRKYNFERGCDQLESTTETWDVNKPFETGTKVASSNLVQSCTVL